MGLSWLAQPAKFMAALADSKNFNITSNLEELLTFTTDAIALLDHSNQSFSQHLRDLIRPCLKEEYDALCLPHIPITGKLFGDELQSQLNSIKVSLATLRPVLLVAAFTRNLAITTGQREKKQHYSQKKQWEKKKQELQTVHWTVYLTMPGRYRLFCIAYPCSCKLFYSESRLL